MPQTAAKKLAEKFIDRTEGAIEYYIELITAIQGKRREAALETMLAEQFALNIVVLWEVYLSDILIAYLSMSPNRYSKSLKVRALQSLRDRFGAAAADLFEYDPPREFSEVRIRSLVDPKKYNITVDSADKLRSKANELLAAKFARRFTLDTFDAQLLNFIVALRNYLAHRSKSAHNSLKAAVASMGGANAPLNAPASRVGIYLKQRDGAGNPRAVILARRIIDLASVLA